MRLLRTSSRLCSALFGLLAEISLPVPIRKPLYGLFARWYRVRREDCVSPLEAYPSFQTFFLRDVTAREIQGPLCSPVDALVAQVGTVESGNLVQAKGRKYTLAELSGDGSLAAAFDGGTYATLYLAPGDYHHVHSPVSGEVIEARFISGALLPVNEWSVTTFDHVFSRNERLLLRIRREDGRELLLVMVGALNVGSLVLSRPLFSAKTFREVFSPRGLEIVSPRWSIKLGERIGSFRLGSTVILVLPQGERFNLSEEARLRFGQRLV